MKILKTKYKTFNQGLFYLCFPTLHLFAPEISNAYYYDNNMDYLPVLKAIGRLGQSFRMQENKFQPKRAKILLNDLLLIKNYETLNIIPL